MSRTERGMRILCDHNVHGKYVRMFRRTDWITVTTVREELSPSASDREISRYAATNEWVVFTEDDDYLTLDNDRGLVVYRHIESPSPTDVVDALETIATAYSDHREIETYVPGEWL